MYKQQRVSVVIPALNEAQSIVKVIEGLWQISFQNLRVIDEIVVCDNGSTDGTAQLAINAGATVVYESDRGYGRACLKALGVINNTDIILFIDADHAFYAQQALPMIDAIAAGTDLAIGSRVLGKMEAGALSGPQKLGNQLASFLIRLIWQHRVSDLGPFRAVNAISLWKLQMQDKTFGWTIEMQIKAIQNNMLISEVPVDTRRRIGVSKISGTVKGTLGAGIGILGMIAKLWWQRRKPVWVAS